MPDEEKPKRIVGEGAASAGCHDQISFILFIANVVVVIVFACMYATDNDVVLPDWLQGGVNETLSAEVHLGATAAGLSLAGVLGLTVVWLVLLFVSALILIIAAQLLLVAALIGSGCGMIYAATNEICVTTEITPGVDATACTPPDSSTWFYIGAVVSFACAALVLLWLCCIRERIAFTAMILTSVSKVLLQLPELLLIQLAANALVLGYGLLWFFAFMELTHMLAGAEWWLIVIGYVLAVFSFFWGQLVLQNIALVTTCGAVGSWYFSPTETTSRGCLFCRPAVCVPLIRACTVQLGSIALGALLVAVVRTVIVVVRYIAETAGQSNWMVKLAFCCCLCLLSCLERCIKWLTDYAFVYVAIYGTSFITSGMRVMALLASSGVGAIAQQSLVTPVLTFATLLGAGIGGLMGYAAYDITAVGPEWLGIAVGVGVGYVLTAVMLAPIDAGSKALFVCYAESPQGLKEKSPELAAKLGEGKPLKEPLAAP